MSMIDKAADAVLSWTAGRWPVECRQEQLSEWSAELHILRSRGASPWRRLRFAMSLATSPPFADENQVPKGWRELLPHHGRRLRAGATLFAAGALGYVLAAGVLSLVMTLLELLPREDPLQPNPIGWQHSAAAAMAMVVTVVSLGALARHIGRRAPLSSAQTRRGRLSAAVAPPVLIGLGAWTLQAIQPPGVQLAMLPTTVPDPNPYLVWTAGFVLLALLINRLVRRGRTRFAWAAGIGGGLLLADVVAMVAGWRFLAFAPPHVDAAAAPLWFPMAIAGLPQYAAGGGPVSDADMIVAGLSNVVVTTVALSAFAVPYLIRAAGAVPEPAMAPHLAGGPAPAKRMRLIAGGIYAAALAMWAYCLAVATPRTDHHDVWDNAIRVWVIDMRQSAILVAVLALAMLLAGRGHRLTPLIGATVVLLATDAVIDGRGHSGGVAATIVVAIGVAVPAAGWWLSDQLATRLPDGHARRRELVVIAVTAAMCIPVPLAQFQWHVGLFPEGSALAIPELTIALSVLLAVVAMATALASRRHRPHFVVSGGGIVLFAVAGGIIGSPLADPWVDKRTALLLGPVLAVIVMWAARWDAPKRPFLAAAGWLAMLPAGLLVAVPISVVSLLTLLVWEPIFGMLALGPISDNILVAGPVVSVAFAVALGVSRIVVHRPPTSATAITARRGSRPQATATPNSMPIQ